MSWMNELAKMDKEVENKINESFKKIEINKNESLKKINNQIHEITRLAISKMDDDKH